MIWPILLGTTALFALGTAPARADPIITPLVTLAISAAAGISTSGALVSAAGLAIGGISVVGLVSGAIEIGLLAGASLLLAPKRKTSQDPTLPRQPTMQSIAPQSISPRYYAAGRILSGGVNVFKECEDGTKLIEGVVLNCEPIDGIDAYLIDGENITSWGTGPFPVLSSFYSGVVLTIDCGPNPIWPTAGIKYAYQYTNNWTGHVWQPYPIGHLPAMVFDFRNGLPSGNPSTLAAYFLPTLYKSDRDLCCNLAVMWFMAVGGSVILARMVTYPRAWPQCAWVIRGATIYDPRDTGQTFDSSSIPDFFALTRAEYLAWYFGQKATWIWSRNAILVLAWYMTHYDGARIDPAKLYWADWKAEATYCDRAVSVYGGGTEAWARCDIQWHCGEEIRDVMARLQAACDATVWEDGDGLWHVWIFKDIAPTVTITDDDISSIVIEEGNGALDEINHLTPSYMEPRENYQMIPAAPIRDDASISVVGERAETVTFKEVASYNQAYRLAYRLMKRKNPAMRLTVTGGPSLLKCVGEKVISVSSDATGVSGTFRFEKRAEVVAELNMVTLYLARVGANDYDDVTPPWDPVSPHETSSAPAPTPIPVQRPDAPSLSIATITGDKYLVSTAAVGGAPPTDTSLTYYVEARLVDGAHNPLGGWFELDVIISQWVRESSSPFAVGLIFEAHSWFVQNGTPSSMSSSSFITIV